MDFERYSRSAYAYLDRSRRLLGEFEQARHRLFYVAFELRCAIEAFLYDYLCFLHDGDMSKALKKLYSAKDLRKAILKLEPDFVVKIAFTNIVHRAIDLDVVQIPVPDLDRLGLLHGRLGDFMHVQKEAMTDDNSSAAGWLELENLVKEAQRFLHDLVHPQKTRLELTEEGKALFEDFKAGKRTSGELEEAIRSTDSRALYKRASYHF